MAWTRFCSNARSEFIARVKKISALALGGMRDGSGNAATEFALVLPPLLLLLFGIIKFGIVFNNYIELTNAAAAGARQLAISRGSATPYSSTISTIKAAAPNLAPSKISSVLWVAGAPCTGDTAGCRSAFGDGTSSVAAQVVLTYPCDLNVFSVVVKSCSLNSSSTGAVQ
jgi:Flp pilus assembly protein TadG